MEKATIIDHEDLTIKDKFEDLVKGKLIQAAFLAAVGGIIVGAVTGSKVINKVEDYVWRKMTF